MNREVDAYREPDDDKDAGGGSRGIDEAPAVRWYCGG